MPQFIRAAMIGLLASFALADPAAAALTVQPVSPSGTYTATGFGSPVFTLLSLQLSISCTSSRFQFTISSSGTGTISAGSFVHQGCTSGLGQTTAWTVRAIAELLPAPPSDVLIGFDITVPPRGLQASYQGCLYTVSGSFSIAQLFALPIRRALTPTTVLATLPALAKQGLAVDSAANSFECLVVGATVGLAWSYRGAYALNRTLTVG